jgi:tight adherence protein B
MQLAVAALAFVVIVLILLSAFALSGGVRENVVRQRLEAIEKGAHRGRDSAHLNLIRDELLSAVPWVNRMLLRWKAARRMRNFIAQAGMSLLPGKLMLWSAVLGFGVYVGGQQIHINAVIALVAGVVGAAIPWAYVAIKRSRRLRAFEKSFPEAIDLLGRAVRAGHAFTTGLEMVATELPEPVAGEFRTAFDEQNLGLPLRDALLNLTERVPIVDVRFFVTALLIHKETGGNLTEILDNLAHVIRDRFKLLGDVRVRTAQGRLTAAILIALPIITILMLQGVNPDYVSLLFTDPWGSYMLGGAALMQIIGSALLWKIVSIEV